MSPPCEPEPAGSTWRWGHRPNRTAPFPWKRTMRAHVRHLEAARKRLLRALTAGSRPIRPRVKADLARRLILEALRTEGRFSTRRLARRGGFSHTTAWAVARELGLKPAYRGGKGNHFGGRGQT
jgi:hypothetical protein